MQPSRFVVLRLGCCCKIFVKEHFVNKGNREKRIFALWMMHSIWKNTVKKDTEIPRSMISKYQLSMVKQQPSLNEENENIFKRPSLLRQAGRDSSGTSSQASWNSKWCMSHQNKFEHMRCNAIVKLNSVMTSQTTLTSILYVLPWDCCLMYTKCSCKSAHLTLVIWIGQQ